ncbi:MAG: thymidine phosphorylase [Candidatus Neomarinimicrobiota bacterium]
MIPANIISKKRDGQNLKKDEINFFFKNYLNGIVTDAQMSAMLMAIYFNGMNEDETFTLVEIMLESGKSLDFSNSKRYVADKHSTGGIGDKVSIILAPIMAAAGIKIPMIAGRGLGYTGGTIDKLESIPGFNTSPNLKIFQKWVEENGYAIISQTNTICTADKKIYDLRSKTGTVPSIPLICGSIMSKKIAEGISGLILDIKIGNGTFMKNKKTAFELGSWMKKIGTAFDIKTDIVYTDMNQPLGNYAGLSCEIEESINCLKGKGANDLMSVTMELGSKLLLQAGIANDHSCAIEIQNKIIKSGKALKAFESSVESQGGILKNFQSQMQAKYETFIYNKNPGIIIEINTEAIGWALNALSCGITSDNIDIDYTAGMEFYKKLGSETNIEEPIYRIFCSNKKRLQKVEKMLPSTVIVGDSYDDKPLIY